MSQQTLWERFKQHRLHVASLGLTLDVSRMRFDDDLFTRLAPQITRAFEAMDALEAGAIANPDEGRRVGHYWLRAPERAPEPELRDQILRARRDVEALAARVHDGELAPERAARFTDLLLVGIGGSALGPQLVADALGDPGADRMRVHYFDNTDPDGMARVLAGLGSTLDATLTLVISKSGATPETRNGMLRARAAYEAAGLRFARHAVAITGEGSELDRTAREEGWLARLPMWDWVGGRTSVTSAVGLLPARLQGLDDGALLAGAAACDAVTRIHDPRQNPAMLLALMWHHATDGRGARDMVILPYRDRLLLLSRYLQQLVMESLGKGRDLDGAPVSQGLTVYGNKGSTDQHAYVQQLREGIDNFFVSFIAVREDGPDDFEVSDDGATAADYLHGFRLGTRQALGEGGRGSLTLTVQRVDAFHLGVLIALFERAVGFYASLIRVNAYNQPGVEAGKKAAAAILSLQRALLGALDARPEGATVEQLAEAVGAPERVEDAFHILEHLADNARGVRRVPGDGPFSARYAR